MKFAKWLFLLGAFACLACNQPTTPAPQLPTSAQERFFQEVRKDVSSVTSVSLMLGEGLAARGWRADLARLEGYLRQELPQLQGKTFHVVLQRHMDSSESEANAETIASQRKVMEELIKLQPHLLSVEGSYADRFTRESFISELNISVREMTETLGGGQTVSPEQEYERFVAGNAVMGYAKLHPECHTAGGDWRGVHMLNLVMGMHAGSPVASGAFRTLSRLRSWNTAARMGELMRQDGLGEAAVVIGRNHEAGFRRLAELFGCKVLFYRTL